MTCELVALCIDARDPRRLAEFWAGVLGCDADGDTVPPPAGTGFPLRFVASDQPKVVPNRMHLDLTSTTPEDQERTVARALGLGARHLDVGQRPEEGHVVLADPEGNELCVVGPRNGFLTGCGLVGALSCDGSEAVGRFWSAALDWPLVWDQDGETAIQSPAGGSKIAWGGPPVAPRTSSSRWRPALAPGPEGDLGTEVERLLALGARRAETGSGSGSGSASASDPGHVLLLDPDGNQLHVLARS